MGWFHHLGHKIKHAEHRAVHEIHKDTHKVKHEVHHATHTLEESVGKIAHTPIHELTNMVDHTSIAIKDGIQTDIGEVNKLSSNLSMAAGKIENKAVSRYNF